MGAYVSLHGRKFGFDADTGAIIRDGLEGSAGDQTISAASTASNITPRGTTTLGATAATDYTMSAPIKGIDKMLVLTSTTTLAMTVTLAAGTFGTTAGSTFNKATFTSTGQLLALTGISTSRYQVTGNLGTVTFTTA